MLDKLIEGLKADLAKMSKLEAVGLITVLVGILGAWALKDGEAPVGPGGPFDPPSDVPDPPHVQNLQAEQVSAGTCKVSWANPGNASYAHIFINVYHNGTLLKTGIYPVWIDGGETSHTFTGLAPGAYRFEVVGVVKDWMGASEAYGYAGVDLNVA